MAAFLSSVFGAGWQFFNNQGIVLSGGKINTYLAGSTTPQATWTDSTQLVQNANPIILDSTGRIPGSGEMWLQSGIAYKLVVTDSANNVIGTWDNISGINDIGALGATEWVATGLTPSFVNSTTFTVPGNQTTAFPTDQRIQYLVSAGTGYGYVLSSTFTSLTTIVIVPDSTVLDAGLSTVNVSILKAAHTSVPEQHPQMNATVTVASAATTPIGAANSLSVTVSGVVTITAFDNIPAGLLKLVKFTGSLVLTYNAVSLILPGAGNITTNPGDQALFRSLGAGNWELVAYFGNFTPSAIVSRRDTVLTGPTDITGMPSLLPQAVTGLNLTTQNIASVETIQTATVTFTNGSAVIGWAANTLVQNQAVSFTNSGGALPTNFVAGTTYYVVATGLSTTQFEVAATPGGTPIIAGSAGSGTQTGWAGLQNVLACTAYFGNDSIYGELNVDSLTLTNLTWTGLTNNSTLYLYLLISGGTATTGFTALAPNIVYGATTAPSVTAGQITINVTICETYLGNGTSAVETPLVVIGTVTTSGGNITATQTYNYGKPPTFTGKLSGTLLKRTVYSTAGTFTWIKAAQTTAINVTVKGGGGNGGGANTTGTVPQPGGAEGGTAIKFIDASTFNFQTVTVGAAAGTSSFGSLLSATGGTSATGNQTTTSVAVVLGGIGSSGDMNIQGAFGGYPGTFSGWGGGLSGGNPILGPTGAAGAAGILGCGGSGAVGNGAGTFAGGAGGAGFVIVEEYA